MVDIYMEKEIHYLSNRSNRKEKLSMISFVVPVYNESEMIVLFVERMRQVFEDKYKIEIIFVNDGSSDNTLDCLLKEQLHYSSIRVVDLSRNFGKEPALSAGLQIAKGQVIIPIDVDLQDPPEIVFEMIERWKEGYEVVLGRRIKRDADSWFKRVSANMFYRIHNKISRPNIPENVGDFRLLDRKVLEAINELPESNRFMKGIFSWVGFRTAYVEYSRPERVAGKSKFNGWKLWNFAIEGITSFSTVPLRIWTYIGFMISVISIAFAIFMIIKVIIQGIDIPGYASMMVAITLLGGLQLIGIGVIGEYLGRTYFEAKRRPVFVIRQIYEINENI